MRSRAAGGESERDLVGLARLGRAEVLDHGSHRGSAGRQRGERLPGEAVERAVAGGGGLQAGAVDRAGDHRLDAEHRGAASSSVAVEPAAVAPTDSRTRSEEAPAASSRTPRQEKGIGSSPAPSASPSPSARATPAWPIASNRAGWTPNRVASSTWSPGSATSAKISSPSRQAAPRPWKAGPYSMPASARRS